MAHHQDRGEVVLDDEGAEDRLAEDAHRQQGAEEGEVPAEGPAEPGERAGGDHCKADEAGEEPVAVLDHCVRLERRHRAAVAFGPIGAAKSRPGEADSCPGQHDQRERD